MSSEEISVPCTNTNCGHILIAHASDVERIVQCPSCSRFLKIPARSKKRMELSCPACSAHWNVPIKLRGRSYRCWKCQAENELAGPAQLRIENIFLPEKVSQGLQDQEIIITISNPGTTADILSIEIAFENNGMDVSSFFSVKAADNNPAQVENSFPVKLSCLVDINNSVMSGSTNVYIEIAGKDVLSDDTLFAEGVAHWVITQKRIFVIETEHQMQEKAGEPFGLNLWTYLENGEVDVNYNNIQNIRFETSATDTPFGIPPTIPHQLTIQFVEGRGVTGREFMFSNSAEMPEITAIEDVSDGAQGCSEKISVLAGEFDRFLFNLASPQVHGFLFQGKNEVKAVDQYGNTVTSFSENVQIETKSKKGMIKVASASEPNMIPAEAFQNGIANLTFLETYYSEENEDQLPRKDILAVFCGNKDGYSKEITIEPNPIRFTLSGVRAEKVVEQGGNLPVEALLSNTSSFDLNIENVGFQFRQDNQDMDHEYKVIPDLDNLPILRANSEILLKFLVEVSPEASLGESFLNIHIQVFNEEKNVPREEGKEVSWKVVPVGRTFFPLSGSSLQTQVGEPFGFQLGAFMGEDIDDSYEGEYELQIECDTSISPAEEAPTIPESLSVNFERGVAEIPPVFILTDSSQEAVFRVADLSPGGPRSQNILVQVSSGKLSFFWVTLGEKQINSVPFEGENQISAMDEYGNVVESFAQDCEIFPMDESGKICFDENKKEGIIPASYFEKGVVDLSERKMKYFTDANVKLPKVEEFAVVCGEVQGKSNPVEVIPRPASIQLNRVSLPETINPKKTDQIISLELENQGNIAANVVSVLFHFEQENKDISSHYTLSPNPSNSSTLIPFVPVVLTYNVHMDAKVPTGVTNIEISIVAVEEESQVPLKVIENHQWAVEAKGRIFRISTEHKQQEKAGVPFRLKLESYIEKTPDNSFEGEKIIYFESNAHDAKTGDKSVIPDTLNLFFENGVAVTEKEFLFVLAEDAIILSARERESDIQGRSPQINVRSGGIGNFHVKLPATIENTEFLEGNIVVVDKYENVIRRFQKNIRLELQNIPGKITTEEGVDVHQISGEEFRDGILDLSRQRLKVICQGDILPQQATFKISFRDFSITTPPFQVLPRSSTIHIEEVAHSDVILRGQEHRVTLKVRNDGDLPALLDKSYLGFLTDNGVDESYQFSQPSFLLPPGVSEIPYRILSNPEAILGKVEVHVRLRILEEKTRLEIAPEVSFTWRVEPSGRTFKIQSENEGKETASIPFSLHLAAFLEDKVDRSYNGKRKILFKSNASAAPNGRMPQYPKELMLEFRDGEAVTPRDFIFFNSEQKFVLQVKENMTGGAAGETAAWKLSAGPIHKFELILEPTQKNGSTFEGNNFLIAHDSFGNVKTDFDEDVFVVTHSQRGKISFSQSKQNQVLGKHFQNGVADLAGLGLSYHADPNDTLPKTERLIARYESKEGQSTSFTIEPRPAKFEFLGISMEQNFYQGEDSCPISVRLHNSGDSCLKVNAAEVTFWEQERDITGLFDVSPHPDNPEELQVQAEADFLFSIDINERAPIGEIVGHIKINAHDHKEEDEVCCEERAFEFLISEKPRTLLMQTEHGDEEKVGEPFSLTIYAYQGDTIDTTFEGRYDIYFNSTATASHGNNPSIPNKQRVFFERGVGKTTPAFVLTNSKEKPTLEAEEEEGRAVGVSGQINVLTGSVKSLKVDFKQAGEPNYQLFLLDAFSNPLDKKCNLDEDIKQGVILSGSRGSFYEVLDVVGHGAMGKVFKARRLNDGLMVAIKTMLFSALSDINRFLMEGLMLMRFDHPNIVQGYDVRQICTIERRKAQLKFFMVMEYLPGQSVKDLLDSSPDHMLPLEWATKIILHSARALVYMWEHDTIHRDVKPENIQITEDKKIKMVDLGIAKATGGMADIEITARDSIVGSYPYISPERIKNTEVDFKADMYSLGATYYHMITGDPPYFDGYKGTGGRDLLDYLIKVRTRRLPTSPRKIQPNIPPNISDTIMTMLQIKSSKRYKSGEELVANLEKIYNESKE